MLTQRGQAIKSTLIEHVKNRLDETLEKIGDKDDSASKKSRKKAREEYDLAYVLLEGSKYSDQVQIATHLAKAIHPDLKVRDTTNIFSTPNPMKDSTLVGHSSLTGKKWSADATGNGAINKKGYELHLLLQTPFEGTPYIDMLVNDDQDAVSIIRDILAQSGSNEDQVTQIYTNKAKAAASHTLAKQIFWLVGDNPADDRNFHLLAPLYPSSLIHLVHKELTEARFGQQNSEVRKLRKEKLPSIHTYMEYKGIAVQKLGGTKSHNISQLNSERRGMSYLLSSCPPIWESSDRKSYLGIESALNRFRSFEDANLLVKKLITLLKSDPEKTMDTRQKRERIEQALAQALANFGSAIRNGYEPGWTRNPECNLSPHQKNWLDPDRAELPSRPDFEAEDREFQQALERKDWPDQVATDFALWLNAVLRKEDLPVGDAELKHWAKQAIVDAEWPATIKLKMHRESAKELSHD